MNDSSQSTSEQLTADQRAPVPDSPGPPPSIPDHELLRCIGRGSYGEVWLARNALGSLRAVKVVHRQSFDHDKPYEREFEGLKKFEPISHARESQVDIFHVGRNDAAGFFYYIMELADDAAGPRVEDQNELKVESSGTAHETLTRPSDTLSQRMGEGRGEGGLSQLSTQDSLNYIPRTLKHDLRTRGALPVAECVQIALSLTRALEHLHAHELVHRDIKPSNIIFVKGVPKLADIGLVTSVDATRSFVGTDGYIPPEGPGTAPADLYSLGKVFYECVTGKDRLDFPELPADWRTRPDFDQLLEFNEVLTKACDGDPRQRYQSAVEMDSELQLLQIAKSVKRQRLWQQRFNSVKRLAIAAVVTGLVVVGLNLAKNELARRSTANKSSGETFDTSGTTNPAAWEAYRKGRFFLDEQTSDSLHKAVAQFETAIRIDPSFAEAHAGMATAYSYWYVTDWDFPPKESVARAEKAASKALALKSNLVEPLAALGYASFACEYHPAQAEAQLRRAVRLEPSNERALQWLSMCLSSQGKFDEAIAISRRALQLNPASLTLNRHLGCRLFDAHLFPEAIEQHHRTLELAPKDKLTWDYLAMVHQVAGQWTEARDACLESAKLSGETNVVHAITNAPLAREGALVFWRINFANGEGDPAVANQNPIGSAMEAAMAGEYEKAIQLLENSVGAAQSYRTKVYPVFDALRNDPRYGERFTNVLRRIGFRP
ncbi:MAG: protein kinase [Verrucomicrobia bacterium]|nr:protein kinase [Verrucomicrobiota bacterium]